MLFAVEGGGFFSSSASGYSKGLTLLLLGQKNEAKPMRVTPWNQYQLVDQETVPDLQLASGNGRIARGCGSFGCFGRAATGLENSSPLKVGPNQNQEVLSEPTVFAESKNERNLADPIDDNVSARKIFSLKSSLKKSTDGSLSPVASAGVGCANRNEHEALSEMNYAAASQMGRRNVQWMDATGGELVEVREFEMSEDGLDNEFNDGNEKTCSCIIM
ncbi:uncharacterized protein [Henckelia pumila]|uniref:uncharacterized protein n=1 Tax=Henckelia pumila TaxID=405737 RepID=UPI003C6E3CAD